jgi:hypothetical protein
MEDEVLNAESIEEANNFEAEAAEMNEEEE